jgi:hypothetical protein
MTLALCSGTIIENSSNFYELIIIPILIVIGARKFYVTDIQYINPSEGSFYPN